MKTTQEKYKVNAGGLNLRKTPINGSVLAVMPNNSEVIKLDVDKQNPDWFYIDYKGTKGYASSKYLIKIDDKTSATTTSVATNKNGTYKVINKYGSKIYIYQTGENENLDITVGNNNKLEKLSVIYKNTPNAICAINAGFFSFDHKPEHYGTFMKDGKVTYVPHAYFPDILYYKDGKVEMQNLTAASINNVIDKCQWILGVGCSLVIDGKKDIRWVDNFKTLSGKNPRTAIGYNNKTKVWTLIVADGRGKNGSKGLNFDETASLLIEYGCDIGALLDGGGSTEMVYSGKVVNSPSDGVERSIGSAFVVVRK